MLSTRTRSATWRTTLAALIAVVALGATTGCDVLLEPDWTEPPADGAAALLDQLTVASSGSMSGYKRDRFPHWDKTGVNCNVRDSVLERDGEDLQIDRCDVVGGRWVSLYDNVVLTDPLKVDIDHMVPLANAWRSGANEWDNDRRGEFANDLTRPQLIAVSASSNRSKGDQDPSQWKPPNRDYWCQYAQDWITVKHHWQLSVTIDEKAALADMLETCSWETKP
ncbi:MAG TPA: HNH endonuclease family protein [Micromonosporaceae bacterium]|nr:HNH endonuclease family protein [Micromonosporaceae bacterium]